MGKYTMADRWIPIEEGEPDITYDEEGWPDCVECFCFNPTNKEKRQDFDSGEDVEVTIPKFFAASYCGTMWIVDDFDVTGQVKFWQLAIPPTHEQEVESGINSTNPFYDGSLLPYQDEQGYWVSLLAVAHRLRVPYGELLPKLKDVAYQYTRVLAKGAKTSESCFCVRPYSIYPALKKIDPKKARRSIKSLYLFQCHDYVKIGVANKPNIRRNELQTGNPYTIEILKTYPQLPVAKLIEEAVHIRLSNSNKRGEWFHFQAEHLATIEQVIKIYTGE